MIKTRILVLLSVLALLLTLPAIASAYNGPTHDTGGGYAVQPFAEVEITIGEVGVFPNSFVITEARNATSLNGVATFTITDIDQTTGIITSKEFAVPIDESGVAHFGSYIIDATGNGYDHGGGSYSATINAEDSIGTVITHNAINETGTGLDPGIAVNLRHAVDTTGTETLDWTANRYIPGSAFDSGGGGANPINGAGKHIVTTDAAGITVIGLQRPMIGDGDGTYPTTTAAVQPLGAMNIPPGIWLLAAALFGAFLIFVPSRRRVSLFCATGGGGSGPLSWLPGGKTLPGLGRRLKGARSILHMSAG